MIDIKITCDRWISRLPDDDTRAECVGEIPKHHFYYEVTYDSARDQGDNNRTQLCHACLAVFLKYSMYKDRVTHIVNIDRRVNTWH